MLGFEANRVLTVILFVILTTNAVQLVFGQSGDELEREDSVDDNNNTAIDTGLETEEKSDNSTDDYDYGEEEGREDCESQPTFLDKWKEIYEQGKNVKINKHVRHINETADVLKQFKQNVEFLLKPSDKSQEKYKALEFFSEIDLGLSSDCLTAFTRMLMAMGEGEIWALKCE